MSSPRIVLIAALAIVGWTTVALVVVDFVQPDPVDDRAFARQQDRYLIEELNNALIRLDYEADQLASKPENWTYSRAFALLNQLRDNRTAAGKYLKKDRRQKWHQPEHFSPAGARRQLGENWYLLRGLLRQQRSAIESYLENNYEAIGWNAEELKTMIASLAGPSREEIWEDFPHYQPRTLSEYEEALTQYEIAFLLRSRQFQDFVFSLAAERKLRCYFRSPHFPFIATDQAVYGLGDTVLAHVSIGTYSDPIDSRFIRYVIDGDTLSGDPSGTLKVEQPARRRGMDSLEVELWLTNHLTGEVQVSSTTYKYLVQ